MHFVGDMTRLGAARLSASMTCSRAVPTSKTRLADARRRARRRRTRSSYTQWEAWLALYYRQGSGDRRAGAGRRRAESAEVRADEDLAAAQAAHLTRLRAIDRYPGRQFTNADNLVAQIFASAVIDALVKAAADAWRASRATCPSPRSAPLFMGRDADARRAARGARRRQRGGGASAGRCMGSAGSARRGSRSNMRCAMRRTTRRCLFVRADDPATLNANLAALAGAEVLDLPEKEAPQDAVKIEAALRWLDAHPTWLMILDNVDDEKAVAAVDKLHGAAEGRACDRHRRARRTFRRACATLELDVLDEDAATAIPAGAHARRSRRRARRRGAGARDSRANSAASRSGSNRPAPISRAERIGFARYLKLWREKRAERARTGSTRR